MVCGGPLEEPIGDYRVLASLARGGTAGVYLAEHAATGERVALKVLDPYFCQSADLARRLLGERAISERVRHAGLLDVRGADHSASGVPFIVMEYVQGESLQALLDRGALDRTMIVTIAAQVAAALTALHAAGFVHCDVKPANILVLDEPAPDGGPRIKLVDYGVAHRIGAPPADDRSIAGTPAYMAPEQWRRAPRAESDVYSLGCVLFELLTGRPVFTGALPQLMSAHRHRAPVRPSSLRSDLPPELEDIILAALAKDPAQRPSPAELEHALVRSLCGPASIAAAS